jgi:hypothetical protein
MLKTVYGESVVKINFYSFQVLADMHLFYGRANGNIKKARLFYQQSIPQSNFQIGILSPSCDIFRFERGGEARKCDALSGIWKRKIIL